jgi:membrane-anchored protein YejM (alkaline phosphatase superfamily)
MRHLLACSNPPSDFAAGLDLFGPLPAERPLLVESWTARAVRIGAETLLIRPYGIEVRDADYRPVENARPPSEASAAVLDQMQLLQPGALQSPVSAEPAG